MTIWLVKESLVQSGVSGQTRGAWGPGSQYGRMYNLDTVETLNGEVLIVDKIIPMRGMSYGIHLMLKTAKEEISVHLGPGWFFENQNMLIEKRDKIEVKGSRIIFQGKPAIIAAKVMKGKDVLILRDKNGYPVWSGWRRGRRR